MTKKKKRIIMISIVITLVILIVAALYVNLKVFTVKKVLMADEQEVYIMGTFHTEHFKRYANYSIEEMINAVKNIEPDVVFIEARENSYTEYGVVDGPIDMCIAYRYCSDNNIPVEMIDHCSCALGVILSLCFFGALVGVQWGTIVCAIINGWLIGRISRFLEDKFVFKDALPLRNRL